MSFFHKSFRKSNGASNDDLEFDIGFDLQDNEAIQAGVRGLNARPKIVTFKI